MKRIMLTDGRPLGNVDFYVTRPSPGNPDLLYEFASSDPYERAPWITHITGNATEFSAQRLVDILQQTWASSATDPRDRVFGILGLLGDQHYSAGLLADYTLSKMDVYLGLAAYILLVEKQPLLLCRATPRGYYDYFSPRKLPSWLPNFQDPELWNELHEHPVKGGPQCQGLQSLLPPMRREQSRNRLFFSLCGWDPHLVTNVMKPYVCACRAYQGERISDRWTQSRDSVGFLGCSIASGTGALTIQASRISEGLFEFPSSHQGEDVPETQLLLRGNCVLGNSLCVAFQMGSNFLFIRFADQSLRFLKGPYHLYLWGDFTRAVSLLWLLPEARCTEDRRYVMAQCAEVQDMYFVRENPTTSLPHTTRYCGDLFTVISDVQRVCQLSICSYSTTYPSASDDILVWLLSFDQNTKIIDLHPFFRDLTLYREASEAVTKDYYFNKCLAFLQKRSPTGVQMRRARPNDKWSKNTFEFVYPGIRWRYSMDIWQHITTTTYNVEMDDGLGIQSFFCVRRRRGTSPKPNPVTARELRKWSFLDRFVYGLENTSFADGDPLNNYEIVVWIDLEQLSFVKDLKWAPQLLMSFARLEIFSKRLGLDIRELLAREPRPQAEYEFIHTLPEEMKEMGLTWTLEAITIV